MKKQIFTILFFSSVLAYSQVGINTETPKATLDVTGKPSDISKIDGLIAPRLTGLELKAKDALYGAEQNATLIYVTEALAASDTSSKTANVTSIGYFYFDGNIWQKLTAGSTGNAGNDWSLVGNSGTNTDLSSGVPNFIGTTDAVDFVVKTDNTERERTYKAANTDNSVKKITGGDLNVNEITVGRGKGNNSNNTVVGLQGLSANTTGGFNTGLGSYVLSGTTTGTSNVAIGHSSLYENTTGGSNVSLGASSLVYNTTGGSNVAIGKSALSNPLNKTGSHNIAIGTTTANALEDGTTNNIAIGSRQQLVNATGSNQLNIGGVIFGTGLTGNEINPAGNIGIGTATPATRLEVNNGTTNGAVKIVDGTQGAGKVLTSDADGLATWQAPSASNMGNNWSLTGNSGTDAANNFIGTTDAVDFVVKTDNIERERTYKAANTGNSIKKITGGDLNVNEITVGRGAGNNYTNTVVGVFGLSSNTTGGANTAIGGQALQTNTTGSVNVGVGLGALSKNTEGGGNVALGVSSLGVNTTGNANVAIGGFALNNNKTGNNNIAIGSTAGVQLSDGASNNIVIGSDEQLANAAGSNQLNIGGVIFGTGLTGDVGSPAGNIGIGTATPNSSASLHLGATDKGFLINQVNLTSRTDIVTVPNPVAGMLVYSTNENTLAGKGYYFWSGSSWTKVISESDGSSFGIGEERGYTYIVSAGIQGGTGVGSGASKPTINQMTGRTSFGTKSDANVLSQWLGVFGNTQTLANLPIFEGLRIDPLFNGNSFKPRFYNTLVSDIKVSYSALSTYDNGINNANMVIKPSYYSSLLDGNDDMACSESQQEFDLLEVLFSNGKYYRITFTAYRTDDQPATATTCSNGSCSNVTRKTIVGVVIKRVQ